MMKSYSNKSRAFTIVELLIVIVVIAVLAAISIVSYGGVRKRATITSLTTDLVQTAKLMELERGHNGVGYSFDLPSEATASANNTLTYVGGSSNYFCIESQTQNGELTYHINSKDGLTTVTEGECDLPITVRPRCVASVMILLVTVKNTTSEPFLTANVITDYGTRAFADIAPGVYITYPPTSRAPSIEGGTVTVQITSASGSSEEVFPYKASSCSGT